MTVLFIDDKLNGGKWRQQRREGLVELNELKVDLPHFTVIAGRGGSDIAVSSGEENKLIIHNIKEIPPELYQVQNDTLYINQKNEYSAVKIICKNIVSITAEGGTRIDINKLSSDILHLKARRSRLNLRNSSIGTINLEANNATIGIDHLTIDVLNGQLYNKANFDMYGSKIHRINMEISENSQYHVSK
jgi:hypothetical protein